MTNPGNWWTTITGALAGLGTYLGGVGPKAPETKADWITLAVGALLAVMGYKAQDAVK